MSNTTHKAYKALKKVIRFFLFTLLAVFIGLNLFIILSGRTYIYKGIRYTYLMGNTGPSIYELDIFPHTTLKKADNISPWIEDKDIDTKQIPAVDLAFMDELQSRAFLVFKGDTLLYEKYYDKHDQNTVSNSFSAAKTVVALLVGIAIEEGKIKSLDEPVGNYLPEYKSNNRNRITIRHLLMMASGISWEESSKNPLSDNAESYYGEDLRGLVARQKSVIAPGKEFFYQSGNSQMLGYIVEKATGKTVSEYTQEKIWKRIGTEHDAYWSMDKKNGDEKSFCCLYATARDFGRLGKLILNDGKWEGKQVVPLWYMKEITKNPELATEEKVPNMRYGLHIWTYTGGVNPVYYCRGIKGQYIISIPEENLVIVRLGLERSGNFVIPESRKNDKKFVAMNESKIGHPDDFFRYLRIGRAIAKEN